MTLVLRGYSTKSVSQSLGISPGTVKVQRENIYSKLGVSSQGELFNLFIASVSAPQSTESPPEQGLRRSLEGSRRRVTSLPEASSVKQSAADPATPVFRDLGLSDAVLDALTAVGYESPSPIQAATIPPLLAGRDVLGQAQTGTGKTAAFALPILRASTWRRRKPQALVLAPTRELAIQVAEAFQRYATQLPGFHVLPIYGGQSYGPQLGAEARRARRRRHAGPRDRSPRTRHARSVGAHAAWCSTKPTRCCAWASSTTSRRILEQTPPTRQVALFSATMPRADPAHRADAPARPGRDHDQAARPRTADQHPPALLVGQRPAQARRADAHPRGRDVRRHARLRAHQAGHRGTRRKAAGARLCRRRDQRRHRSRRSASARSRSSRTARSTSSWPPTSPRADSTSSASATCVNYDMPYDTESYVHRIGRTGRAGRSGEAILFVTPRERDMLRAIERATRQPIEPMDLPTIADVNDQRVARFAQTHHGNARRRAGRGVPQLIEEYEREHNVPAIEIAAALARLLQGASPLLLKEKAGERAAGAAKDTTRSDRSPRSGGLERARHAARRERQRAEGDRDRARLHASPTRIPRRSARGRLRARREARQHRRRDRERRRTRGTPDRSRRHSRGSHVRRPAEGHAEPGHAGTQEDACRRGRCRVSAPVAHVPPKPLRKPPKRQSGTRRDA